MKIFLLLLFFSTPVLSSELLIPLVKDSWKIVSYSEIPPNVVSFEDNIINIKVDSSASPLIYKFDKPLKLKSLAINIKVEGRLKKLEVPQGSKGADDFHFRIGVVYAGEETLGFFKKTIAADWVLKLYELAPKDKGIDKIIFYNTYIDKRLKNTSRIHPASDLIEEHFEFFLDENGIIKETIGLKTDKEALALWISCDGDDTKSNFSVKINEIKASY